MKITLLRTKPNGIIFLQFQISTGEFFDVTVDGYGACAVQLDGEVKCWGQAVPPFWVVPPAEIEMDRLAFIYQHACGVTSENEMNCWGFIPVESPEGTFDKVGVGFEDNLCTQN